MMMKEGRISDTLRPIRLPILSVWVVVFQSSVFPFGQAYIHHSASQTCRSFASAIQHRPGPPNPTVVTSRATPTPLTVMKSQFSGDSINTTQSQNHESMDTLLMTLLTPVKECNARRMSSTDLAYIGDVVYELLVRSQFVWPSRRTKDLQNQVVALVRGRSHSLFV